MRIVAVLAALASLAAGPAPAFGASPYVIRDAKFQPE